MSMGVPVVGPMAYHVWASGGRRGRLASQARARRMRAGGGVDLPPTAQARAGLRCVGGRRAYFFLRACLWQRPRLVWVSELPTAEPRHAAPACSSARCRESRGPFFADVVRPRLSYRISNKAGTSQAISLDCLICLVSPFPLVLSCSILFCPSCSSCLSGLSCLICLSCLFRLSCLSCLLCLCCLCSLFYLALSCLLRPFRLYMPACLCEWVRAQSPRTGIVVVVSRCRGTAEAKATKFPGAPVGSGIEVGSGGKQAPAPPSPTPPPLSVSTGQTRDRCARQGEHVGREVGRASLAPWPGLDSVGIWRFGGRSASLGDSSPPARGMVPQGSRSRARNFH